ncbi:MAG: M43 family zinc metalloprotease, partial [Bacteroidota bacterium]
GQTLPEPGIHRISRSQMGFNAPPYSNSYLRNTVLPPTQWDPDRYMNIWTAPLQNDVIGFAQLPSQSTLPDLPGNYGPASTDGIVSNVENFGREAGIQPPYNGGRTTTHEVGHFLGLWHIWGDGNCSVDDYCGDTPTASAPNYGCPSSATSCGQASMVSNYMDYVDDACMNTFTLCQKQRMRTVLENAPRRASLLTSSACAGQLAPLADFRANQEAACEGQIVKFFDESLYGPTSWSWSFPGGDPSTSTDANPQVRYLQPGSYDVSLEVSNAQGNQSLTRQGYINISSVGNNNELFSEDFEEGLGDWTVENPDQGVTWEIESTSGNGGNFAPGIELYFYDKVGERDALISPLIDLNGFQNLTLNIQYAYRPFSNSSFDSLLVYASTDGGNTFPHRLFAGAQGGGATFNTGPTTSTSFKPSNSDDWCGGSQDPCLQFSLDPFMGESQFKIKIESVNDYGNNLYVDNVSITGACSVTQIDQSEVQTPAWRVYPNPSSGWVTLEPVGSKPEELRIQVLDFMGRSVWESRRKGSHLSYELDLRHLPRGNYYLELQQAGLRFGQALQLAH